MRKLVVTVLAATVLGAAAAGFAGGSLEALFRPTSQAVPVYASVFDDSANMAQLA
jgi:hypothetical protein